MKSKHAVVKPYNQSLVEKIWENSQLLEQSLRKASILKRSRALQGES